MQEDSSAEQMPEEIGFYLDEHLPAALADALRRRSIQAVRVTDVGMRTATDEEHLDWSTSNNLVLITHDTDFLRIAGTEKNHAGIIWCPAGKYSIGEMLRLLLQIHGLMNAEKMRNHVHFL